VPRHLAYAIGEVFGRLTVVEVVRDGNRSYWKCRCTCGEEIVLLPYNAKNGHTKSCGCLSRETRSANGKLHRKHGHCSEGKLSREYLSWRAAWQRCFDPNAKSYPSYGARGISMCDHWKSDFPCFFRDMGPRPPHKTLDRIDNNKSYLCPKCGDNCKWSTASEQQKNKRKFKNSKLSEWWMRQTPEYRHQRAVDANNMRFKMRSDAS
jgi:hypothetical protein